MPWGCLEASERLRASGVPASLVLTPVYGTNRFTPHPRAASIPAIMAEVVLNHLVLGMHPCCNPKRAIKDRLFWIRRMPMLSWRLFFIATHVRIART